MRPKITCITAAERCSKSIDAQICMKQSKYLIALSPEHARIDDPLDGGKARQHLVLELPPANDPDVTCKYACQVCPIQ